MGKDRIISPLFCSLERLPEERVKGHWNDHFFTPIVSIPWDFLRNYTMLRPDRAPDLSEKAFSPGEYLTLFPVMAKSSYFQTYTNETNFESATYKFGTTIGISCYLHSIIYIEFRLQFNEISTISPDGLF
jgi:hypothetical protein